MEKLILASLICCFLFQGNSIAQENAEIVGLYFKNSSLQLAKLDAVTGDVELLGDGAVSPDAFNHGVSDFDPFSKTYFYTRGGPQQIYSVSAETGELIANPIIENPNDAVQPITNLAYNWLNDTLYGVEYQYVGGQEQLRLVSVDTETGALNVISDSPVSYTPFLSGNSDIDPIHRRYFYATNNKLYTVDLDSGEAIHEVNIGFPLETATQFFVNIAYNWMDNKLYGLHFNSLPVTEPFGDPFSSELRLSEINVETGELSLISSSPTSPDGFSMGDCDIDVVQGRYFYIRQNQLYVVELSSGELLDIVPIANDDGAVAPIINMSYDDLASPPPTALPLNMGDPIYLEANETVRLEAYVGEDVSYKWNDGSENAYMDVTESGDYSVEISRGEMTISGSINVTIEEESTTSISEQKALEINLYPNPSPGIFELEGLSFTEVYQYELFDLQGRLIERNLITNSRVSLSKKELNEGIYLLKVNSDSNSFSKKIQITY